MPSISKDSAKLARYRVEIGASIIFDVIMPEEASDDEVTAQGSANFRALLDSYGGITLHVGLQDCRLYMDTKDNWNPSEVSVQDVEPYIESEDEDDD